MMRRDVGVVDVTRVEFVFQAMQIASVEEVIKVGDAQEVVARDSTLF